MITLKVMATLCCIIIVFDKSISMLFTLSSYFTERVQCIMLKSSSYFMYLVVFL